MYFDYMAAYWACTGVGGFLVLAVTGLSLRDLIRPPAPLKDAANGRNLSGPLKGVLVGLILALVRVVLGVVSAKAVPSIGDPRAHAAMAIIRVLVDFSVRFCVLSSLLRVARRFHSSTPASDFESGAEGLAKPNATASTASKRRALDWAVMFMIGLLGFTYWALYLAFYLLTIYGNYNWNLVKFVRAEGAVGVTYNCWVIVTMLYIIFVLLSKRRRADAMGGGTPGTTDAHARIAFTLKTIPTMVFVGVVLFVITIIDSFFFSLRTSDMGYQALYVLNLLAVLVGEPLLLEFSRGALRRLAKLS